MLDRKQYDLIFRTPEEVWMPFYIDLVVKGNKAVNFIFIHRALSVEAYLTKKEYKKAGKIGLKLYSNPRRTINLINSGKKYSRQLGLFQKKHPIKLLKNKNDKQIERNFKDICRLYTKLLKVYHYTEYFYFTEVEKKIKNHIFNKVADEHAVNYAMSLLLNSSGGKIIREKRNNIIKEYNLDDKIVRLCDLVALISKEKLNLRKGINNSANYFQFMMMEIARRFYLSPRQIENCRYSEILKLFENKAIDIDEINKRGNNLIIIKKGGKWMFLTGKEVERTIAKFTQAANTKINKIEGDIMSLGKASGRVVKLSFGIGKENSEKLNGKMRKMKKGDILVTETTGPEMIMACKKAGAIVAEEGGINSHAAVISRELGIPGIVNVKMATKVLNDGDLVEVDANKGIIKLLKNGNN